MNTLPVLLAACAPGPSATVSAEVEAMDAFVHATHAATQRLTTHGEALGNALFDLVEGKGTEAAVEAAEAAALADLRSQRAALAAYDGPTRPPFEAYRTSLDAYLALQETALSNLATDGIALARADQPLAERGRALEALARRSEVAEQEAAQKVQRAMDRLYASF